MNKYDDMVWSFSRLQTYVHCPYSFYLQYIEERKDRDDNFYSQNGSCVHKALEAYFKDKIKIEDVANYYLDLTDGIAEMVSQPSMNSIMEKCVSYLAEMQPLDEKYDILAVEKELNFKLKDYKFIGFADLLLRNKETDDVILVDHKSANHFFGKTGKVLKGSAENYEEYKKQMYLYAYGIAQTMNENVSKIVWHHFKDNGALTQIGFNQNDLDETLKWASDLIEQIKNDEEFNYKKSFIRCHQLCDFRRSCEYKDIDDGDGNENE